MHKLRKKVFRFAIVSRITVLVLQFMFNLLCPDHHADAFRSPIDSSESVSLFDNVVTYLFGGLTRWDGEYFIHIAKYGYTYENTLAFYPLYPLLIRIIATFIRKVFFIFNTHSSVIIAAILINIICFIKSTIIFYDLSKIILRKTHLAYKAAILYCINPATIFFSAVYSESLFAYLTYYSMLKSIQLNPLVSFPIALSILTRSNGMVNIGFPIYFGLKELCHSFSTKYDHFSVKALGQFLFLKSTLKSVLLMCNILIISVAPFILLQIYNYIIFCIPHSNQTFIPQHIEAHSRINNLVLPGSDNVEWCHAKIPIAYSYIQKKYWNIGLFNYYELKQIPNFILAFPVLSIMITCIKEYFFEHRKYSCALGFVKNAVGKELVKTQKYPAEMLVFIIHGLFLTIFCIFFVHIQVSTRLISSASPLIYWYCTLTMQHVSRDNDDTAYESEKNMFFFIPKTYSFKDKVILSYFLGYIVLGCFMFPNFLPWT
ncbi:GPI mannosyltransferase 2 [Hylaeus anthracinus]|uniref:GPI mannosyltransferase 2 n=1 Tax=Hylaeus anthracinus TaxID=313031 RepID=UPI0023B9AB93|nr:GPI mannosyltransferase 2 [Hylaeus anthracinus]